MLILEAIYLLYSNHFYGHGHGHDDSDKLWWQWWNHDRIILLMAVSEQTCNQIASINYEQFALFY